MSKTSVQKAIEITAAFEGSRGYTNVAGNFDGMGLSFGIFQWNAGMHTLQPLLKDTLNAIGHERAKAIFTNDDLYVLQKRLADGDHVFHQWSKSLSHKDSQGRIRVKEPWYSRFVNLAKTEECQIVQRRAMRPYIERARKILLYSLTLPGGHKSERAFALALDIAIQNGSVVPKAEEEFWNRVKPGMNEKSQLYVLAQAVANASLPKWREDVRSRKMCIASGKGRVHGKTYDLEAMYGLTDAPMVWGEFG